MLDTHYYPQNWGIRPVLFEIFGYRVPAYSFFVLLGLIAGIIVYIVLSKKNKVYNEKAFYIFIAAFIFGTLGAKLPIWIANYKNIAQNPSNIAFILSGRTIVGGLIGGTLGVILTKRILNIKQKMGNQIAPAAALGVGIGRIGCFFRGCCYGIPTKLLWGVDFGDGVSRHATQLYEVVFQFTMFIYLMILRKKLTTPGILFKIYLNSYFIFRFFIEFIRVEEKAYMGFTWFQLAAVLSLVFINRNLIWKLSMRSSKSNFNG